VTNPNQIIATDQRRVALLQADGQYNLEKNAFADAGDVFHGAGVNYLGPSAGSAGAGPNYPNTDAYRLNNVVKSGVTIYDISTSAATMTFSVIINASFVVAAPTATPTIQITRSPTIVGCNPPFPSYLGKQECIAFAFARY
jgi:hypothetical protein